MSTGRPLKVLVPLIKAALKAGDEASGKSLPLVKYDAARAALQVATKIDDVKGVRDKAIALAAYARQAKDPDMAFWVAEIKARAERRAGEILKEMPDSQPGPVKDRSTRDDLSPTLEEIGVTPNQSSVWQKIASIPDATFEEVLEEAEKPVTTSVLLSYVPEKKTKKPKKKGGVTKRIATEECLMPSEANELEVFVATLNSLADGFIASGPTITAKRLQSSGLDLTTVRSQVKLLLEALTTLNKEMEKSK